MDEFNLVLNFVLNKQNNKDTYCLGLSKNIKELSNELKNNLYRCYFDFNQLNGVIVYNITSNSLNILFAYFNDSSFNDKVFNLKNEYKDYTILFNLESSNILNSNIDMKIKKVTYSLQLNRKIKESNIFCLVTCDFKQHIYDELSSLYGNSDILNSLLNNKNYIIKTIIYNNELIGYITIYKGKELYINDFYLKSEFLNKEFINSIICDLVKSTPKIIKIITSNEIIINTLLENGSKEIDSVITYYLS